MRRGNQARPRQCGICERWTVDGEVLPSGNRDPETGRTPHDNFVCRQCHRDRRVGAAKMRQSPAGNGLPA
jgi:hypothetical protein